MSTRTLWLGAVAYDAKVVPIWEGMRRYFHDEAQLPLEIVLFQTYEAQVQSLLADGSAVAPRIDIAWNTNLAYLQSLEWSRGGCTPIAMRDTDLGWTTKIIALTGGPVRSIDDLRGRTLALGSRDSGHAAILPVHFLADRGLREGADYTTLRFNTDMGKHGDTGTSEVDVLRASPTVAPMPGQWAARSGRKWRHSSWSRPVHSASSGRVLRTLTACSRRGLASSRNCGSVSPTRSTGCNSTTRHIAPRSRPRA